MVRTSVVVVAVVLLLGGAAAAAFVTGVGPAPGGDDEADIESFPTETSTAGDATGGTDAGSGDGSGTNQAAATPPFTFSIDQVEECGTTCRDVTVTLYNEQNTSAADVTVYTRIYAGNSTDEGDRIWQGTQSVGEMAAGGSVTRTQRVDLTYGEAYSVKQQDGWITIVTTVQSENETVTFTRHRDVA